MDEGHNQLLSSYMKKYCFLIKSLNADEHSYCNARPFGIIKAKQRRSTINFSAIKVIEDCLILCKYL